MASYYLNLTNDGSGNFTPVVRKGGTASSGGTSLTIPTGELFAGTAQTTTKLLGLAIMSAGRAVENDYVSNPTATYYINVVDDGNGVFTPTARRGGTASSGGTTISYPSGELFPGTTTKLIGLAIGSLERAALNDRAANG